MRLKKAGGHATKNGGGGRKTTKIQGGYANKKKTGVGGVGMGA